MTEIDRRVDEVGSVVQWAPSGNGAGGDEQVSTDQRVRIEVLTARELCALPDPDRSDELLGPLVVRGGRTIVGGHTGEGKTTFTAACIAAIVKGETFLEWEGAGGRALVLDLEQGLRTVKRVLREARLHESDAVDYARVPDGLALDSNAHDIAAVLEIVEAKLVYLVYVSVLVLFFAALRPRRRAYGALAGREPTLQVRAV